MRLFPYLVLIRPANVLTAISDVIAGFAIAGVMGSFTGSYHLPDILLLILSTIGLYGGGIVFNDIFDLELDRVERPERILPSGRLSLRNAVSFGILLLSIGIITASLVSFSSMMTAVLITLFALLYDKFGKHHAILGPINMGACRGLNLLLGMSVVPLSASGNLVYLIFMPVVFIAAVTLTSRGEVSGNNRNSVFFALCLDLLIASVIITLGIMQILTLSVVIPFVVLWLFMNLNAKVRAIIDNQPQRIMFAVKTGVLSLIPLNATYVAGFGHWMYAILVLLLLPAAILLSRKFSVT